jgi:16S rRNA (cytosine967-C5)-methyltransferase
MAASRRLDSRDAGLASELVFGCLRRQGQLDFLLRFFSHREPSVQDSAVRIALRMGVYQMRMLDRIPPHAAVGESVELVKRNGKASAAGFVNAVLRKVHRNPVRFPERWMDLSMPAWMLHRWDDQFGPDVADKIARSFLDQPEVWVRIPPGTPLPETTELEPTPGIPGAYKLVTGSTQGLRIQDAGSQSIIPLLDLQPGQTFLDLCAAPGNKTAQALEAGVRAIACDIHLNRLKDFQATGVPLVVLDATAPLPFNTKFDRILVDAPCSGTGTLGRNPEIRWRIQPTDFAPLAELQGRLLSRALEYLAPGGLLVYSTCSLEREENEDVVRAVLGHPPAREVRRTPGLDAGDGFYAAVIPSK